MRRPCTTENLSNIEALQGLMDRLCAPDLTAAEARDLRPRLFRLLEAIEAENSRRKLSTAGDRKMTREPLSCLAV